MHFRGLSGRLAASLCIGLSLFSSVRETSAQTFVDPNFTTEILATVAPFTLVGMAWAPDGRLFVWQKNGVVRVIKNGVLKNFLMSRMPVKGFAQSNGHGRAQAGLMATGRQGEEFIKRIVERVAVYLQEMIDGKRTAKLPPYFP